MGTTENQHIKTEYTHAKLRLKSDSSSFYNIGHEKKALSSMGDHGNRKMEILTLEVSVPGSRFDGRCGASS